MTCAKVPRGQLNTCGTCMHFGERVEDVSYIDEGPDDQSDRYDYVEAKHLHECNLLAHLNKNDESKKLAMTATAGVIDGSGYYAVLCVSEDFGCNQWEAGGKTEPIDQ